MTEDMQTKVRKEILNKIYEKCNDNDSIHDCVLKAFIIAFNCLSNN